MKKTRGDGILWGGGSSVQELTAVQEAEVTVQESGVTKEVRGLHYFRELTASIVQEDYGERKSKSPSRM